MAIATSVEAIPLPQECGAAPARGMHGKCVYFPALKLCFWRYVRAMSTEPADIALEENDVLTQFEALGLDVRALNAVARMELEKPTDVQREAIPPFMRGRDVVATAPTGTGKTLAFLLPLLSRLSLPAKGSGPGPRAIILSPTRELGEQIWNVARDVFAGKKMKAVRMLGGEPYAAQNKALQGPLDLVIATPGRLIDHLDADRMAMFRLETLIIDEADRMLDVGFRQQIQRIARACGSKRQTGLYTATLTKAVRELALSITKDASHIGLAEPDTIPETIIHNLVFCDSHEHKLEVLDLMLSKGNVRQALVFVTTQKAVEELIEHVSVQGHTAAPAHGGMTTAERSTSVNAFRRKKVQLLVATDVAARGMDIPGLRDVIMMNLPIHAEDYVHRIGRVGRAGSPGWSWALVSNADKRRLAKIEKLLGKTLSSRPIPSLIAEEHREYSDDDLVRARSGRGAGSDLRGTGPRREGRSADRGADRGAPRGGDRGGARGGDRGAPRGGDRGGPRGGDRGAARGGDRGAARGGDRGAPRGADRGAARGGDRGAPQGGDRGAPRGGDRGAPRGGDRGAPRGGDRGAARGGDRGPRAGADRSPRSSSQSDKPKENRVDQGERKPSSNDRPGRPDRGARNSKGPDRNDNRRGQNPSGPRGGRRDHRS